MVTVNEQLQTHPVTFTANANNDSMQTITGTYSNRNITDWTLLFQIRRPDGTLLERPGVVTDGPNGIFTVDFLTGDLQAGYKQLCSVEAIDTSTSQEGTSKRFYINVDPEQDT